MLDPDRRKSYGVTSAILAWLVLFGYVACFITSPAFDRLLGKGSTETSSHGLHIIFGLLVLLLVVLRLFWWIKNQSPQAPKRMPENAFRWSRMSLLLMYLNVLQLAVTGLLSAWAAGLSQNYAGLAFIPLLEGPLAAYAAESHGWSWQINSVVLLLYCVVNVFVGFRYKSGYRRMLPGVHV